VNSEHSNFNIQFSIEGKQEVISGQDAVDLKVALFARQNIKGPRGIFY
jgi:hypothetical protein